MCDVLQNTEHTRIPKRTMKARLYWDDIRRFDTIGQDHRGPIPVHGRGVIEAFKFGIGFIECARPVSSDGPWTGHQSHRRACACREGAGEIQELSWADYFETGQPGFFVPAIDDPGLLKNFGEARDRIVGGIQDSSILLCGLFSKVMIEARIGGPDVSKLAPPRGMVAATKIDPPNDRGRLDNLDCWSQRFETLNGWSARDLWHASKVARNVYGGCRIHAGLQPVERTKHLARRCL